MENNNLTIEKKAFVAPELTFHGDVEAITLAGAAGTVLDATFPAGTPFNQLTFS